MVAIDRVGNAGSWSYGPQFVTDHTERRIIIIMLIIEIRVTGSDRKHVIPAFPHMPRAEFGPKEKRPGFGALSIASEDRQKN